MVIWLDSDSRYFTPWLVGVWGIIQLIGLLIYERNPSDHPVLSIPASLQFILCVVLLIATCLAINWHDLGQRDVIQAGFVLFTLPFYREGFQWGLRTIRVVFRNVDY